jgi:hypothetical protein
MINLHKIIELCDGGKLRFYKGIDITDHEMLLRFVKNNAGYANGFHMGPIDSWDNIRGNKFLTALPYPVCWFEVDSISNSSFSKGFEKVRSGVLCRGYESSTGNEVECIGLEKPPGYDWTIYGVRQFKDVGDNILTTSFYDSFSGERMEIFCHLVSVFLTALKCTNTKTIENHPPAKLQKKRKKQGKVPLFSYHTLHLDIPNKKNNGESLGGTHASPRLHLRRGHIREYQPGKFCWVQPCMVGDPEKGFVGKDYQARIV